MTYETNEISNQDGEPVSLYEFQWGQTFWRYTSADQDVVANQLGVDYTYTAIAISDDGMVQGGSSNNDLKVDVQNDIPIFDLFRSTPPSASINLTVRRKHFSDPNDQWFVYWVGVVANVKKANVAGGVVLGQSLLSTLRRSGLRLCWTRSCPHMLYDTECRVDPTDFDLAATVTAVGTDGTITISTDGGHPAGYFDGGYVEWQASAEGTLDQRSIESSVTSTQLKIFGSNDRFSVGLAVILYPGCDLTAQTCQDKFSNLANFGGLEQMSGENPFDGRNNF